MFFLAYCQYTSHNSNILKLVIYQIVTNKKIYNNDFNIVVLNLINRLLYKIGEFTLHSILGTFQSSKSWFGSLADYFLF